MKVLLAAQVVGFVRRLPPEPKQRMCRALRDLGRGRGDIKPLQPPLDGYCGSRVGGYRIVFAYGTRATIECVFAEQRSIVCTIVRPPAQLPAPRRRIACWPDTPSDGTFRRVMRKPLITTSPDRLGGTPVFAGTRVPVQTLIEYLEGGDSLTTFLDDFPSVSREHTIAVLEEAKSALLAKAVAA